MPPRPPVSNEVTVKSVAVNTVIREGGVAETTVSHVFSNHTARPQEADFLFPIPAGATVSSFAMFNGETRMDARLLDKDEATRTYEEIVRRRRDPALLTFQGQSALRARVFPIPAGGESRVTLKLVTVLPREGDARKYSWPLVGAYLPGNGRPESVSVHVSITGSQPVGNVYSPTHPVRVRRDSETQVVALWESGRDGGVAALAENPQFDLFVSPTPAGRKVALSVLTYNASLPQVASLAGGARASGYFMVVASPAVVQTAKTIVPRHVVLVLDRSGSMQGRKIEQAKGALRFALGGLRPQDSFNVMTFSDRVEKFAPALVAASPDNLKRAGAFVDDIVADGGTNINEALTEGLNQFAEKSTYNTVLFFTDGLPTVGQTNHDTIIHNATTLNARKARVFAFGVGYDVDVPFLDTLGRSLRGDADYVRPDENIEAKTSQFVAKTNAPVLENLHVSVSGASAGEMYPRPDDLPDLFAGGQLVLVGRYTGADNQVRVTLTGDANGKPQTYQLDARFPALDTQADFLPRLWASRKIGTLMDEVRLRPEAGVRDEIVQQIIALSREYGILTPYTALFVPEPGEGGATYTNSSFGGVRRAAGGLGGGGLLHNLTFDSKARGKVSAPLAAAPRLGEGAVNQSQASRAQRTTAQVGNSYAYNQTAGADRRDSEALTRQIQYVASRTFYQTGPVWTDATYDKAKQKQIVKVKAFSPAYFALTRRSANLARWASLGDQVLVAANGSQAVQFGPDGRETLTEAEVAALTRP